MLGVLMGQTIDYWKWSGDDRLMNKVIAVIATVSSLAASLFFIGNSFELFVYGFGTYAKFVAVNSLSWACLIDIIPSTVTQFFFAHRAWRMSHNSRALAVTAAILVLTSVGGALATIPAYQKTGGASQSAAVNVKVTILLWICGGIGVDLLVTVVILQNLIKSRTGWKTTDRTIKKLLTILVETQIPPIIIMIIFLISYIGYSGTYLDIWPQWVQSKFYVCGLMASLNSRYFLRRALVGSESQRATQQPTVVHVLTETHVQKSESDPSSKEGGKPFLARLATDNKTAPRNYPQASPFTPRRVTRPPLDIDLDADNDSLDGKTVTLGSDRDDGHKLDYIENASRTGLTADVEVLKQGAHAV
ncbi:hypothetical protein I350_04767 [Cryptococcus amylolentus CBS 6273]|uniref:DUF6534 domain-containing protein n=1 Tax=Cryptococcus amylolentus CBS 6273 TaxID=1296118 RepID=A0A1E3JZR3_9TREE|nr:hypothetical protein I350_04767 [Cryptococcus amylolentus CBS 6273]